MPVRVESTPPAPPPSTADSDDLTRVDAEGLTSLHHAARRGDAAAVSHLLERGGDANAHGRGGVTPLHVAMEGAARDALIRSVAPPEQRQGWSVAKARARERETRGRPDPARGPMQFVEVTRLLLAHGADASAATAEGLTPLHLAAGTGNLELVSPLIDAKADVNAVYRPRSTVATTPLVAAAAGGDLEVVRRLLDAGADPAKVPEASQAYFLNLAMNDVAIFRLLLDRGLQLPPDALTTASRYAPAEAAAEIVRRGKAADPDKALYATITGSHRGGSDAVDEERLVQTVRVLLDAGASPSAPDGTGAGLVEAVARGRARVVHMLRERGAKVDWSRLTDRDHSPAWLAYAAAFEQRVDRLREFEALGMPLDPLGASILGRVERLRALVTADKASVAGEAGATSLYFAARYGHLDCVRVLLDTGADPNARVPSWDTPDIGPRALDGAAIGGSAAIVRLLLDRGADPKLIDLDDEERAKLPPEIRELLGSDDRR